MHAYARVYTRMPTCTHVQFALPDCSGAQLTDLEAEAQSARAAAQGVSSPYTDRGMNSLHKEMPDNEGLGAPGWVSQWSSSLQLRS